MSVGDKTDQRSIEARLALLEMAVAERDAELAEQEAKIAALTEQLAKLTELLNRNSTNSHLPPSSDGPGAGQPSPSRRSKSGRKRGGQKGRRGKHRELLPPEQVEHVVDLYPDVCLGCALQLPQIVDMAACRYQQLDLHEHRPQVTEWRRHEVGCPRCGTFTRAAYASSVIPSTAFGPSLTAVVAMLTGVYHLSRRKAQRLFQELFDIKISLGAISAMEHRASEALASAHQEALGEAQQADVKHADATSWTRAGVLMSLWTLASEAVTAYQIFENGCRDTIKPMFGPQLGILVSDRAAVFNFWVIHLRQICHAHLLRKFVAFSERDGPAGDIGNALLQLTGLIFEYWHGFKDGLLNREELSQWIAPVQRDFERALERGKCLDLERFSGSCADILAHRNALWTFVTHSGVEPTNNHAELELRDFVLWRKRSFGSQSERGERFAVHVMTAVRTARKQGKDVLDFIVGSVTAHVNGTQPPRLLGGVATA